MFTGKTLYISTPKYKEVPKELWDAEETESLTITCLEMARIPNEIQNLTNLTKLSVSQNNLEEVPPQVLRTLTRLKSFDCASNKVQAVSTSMFPESLASLTFHHNEINSFVCDAPLPNLTALSLVENNLPAVAPSGIGSFSSLCSLNLSYNPKLEELPPSFSELKALETLKIVGSGLKVFPACLYELDNLKCAQLASNSIAEFEESPNGMSVVDMKSLRELDLNENMLVELPQSLFETNLSVLLLQANRIEKLPRFGNICNTLVALDVSENRLKKLPKTFYNLKLIKTINIS